MPLTYKSLLVVNRQNKSGTEVDNARGRVGKLLWAKRTHTFITTDRYLSSHN